LSLFLKERLMAKMSRRQFVTDSVLASTGMAAAAAISGAQAGAEPPRPAPASPPAPKQALPMGKLGNIPISRVILGGNLLSGFSHSRDLRYVSALMQHYNTPERIYETFRLAEANGINALVIHCNQDLNLLRHYRRELGGNMKWIIFALPDPNDKGNELAGFQKGIDAGADVMYIHGDPGLQLIRAGRIDLFKRAVDFIKDHGMPAGVSTHSLEVVHACEKARLNVDFYLKTFHRNTYPTAPRPGEPGSKGHARNDGAFDNSWCQDAEETARVMNGIGKPWIAFKVMAAGALPPRESIQYAFSNGADFVLAGMFDWQVAEDARIARDVLAGLKRTHPWRA